MPRASQNVLLTVSFHVKTVSFQPICELSEQLRTDWVVSSAFGRVNVR
jgi:hypothetical protein